MVVRRGKTSTPPSEADIAHREGQEALAALSTRGVLMVAQDSGHTIPLDEPAVVAEAVRRAVEMGR